MENPIGRVGAVMVLAALCLTSTWTPSARGGDLSPPAGPIEATMKSLEAIEPRSILKSYFGSGTAVHLVTQPAHIVLTEDVSVPAGKSGIVIDLPPGVEGVVSIDLNGFSIVGQPGSLHAVHCKAGGGGGGRTYNLLSSFPATWRSVGGSGLRVDGALSVSVSGVVIRQCGADGIIIVGAEECDIAADVHDCAGDGVEFAQCSRVTYKAKAGLSGRPRLRVAGSGGHGVHVHQCDDVTLSAAVRDSALDGVHVIDTLRCELITDVAGCGGVGVRVDNAGRCDAEVEVSTCAGHGVHLSNIPAGFVTKKGSGQLAGKKRGDVSDIGGHGILAENCARLVVSGVSVTDCGLDGLHVSGAASVQVEDWRDEDCDGDGVEIKAGGAPPPDVRIVNSSSTNAGGNGARLAVKIGRIELMTCTGAGLHGMDIDCDDLVLSECTSSANTQCGLSARVRRGMQDIGSAYNDNGWQGSILAPALGSVQEKANKSRCSARGNGFSLPGGGAGFEFSGISSVSMHECDASSNAGSGVVIGDLDRDGRLDLVTCSSNGLHGVHVPAPTSGLPGGRLNATGVLTDGNSMDGMRLEGTTGGQISECVSTNNGAMGMVLIGASHVVRGNTCTSNAGGPMFVPVPGNVVGPLVDELTVAGNCNPAANYVH